MLNFLACRAFCWAHEVFDFAQCFTRKDVFHAAGVFVGDGFGDSQANQETFEQKMSVQNGGGNALAFFGEFHAAGLSM